MWREPDIGRKTLLAAESGAARRDVRLEIVRSRIVARDTDGPGDVGEQHSAPGNPGLALLNPGYVRTSRV